MQVVAALIVREARVLICQRREAGTFPLKWEFPGGKVEEGEGLVEALSRELREELWIEIPPPKEIFRHHHTYRDGIRVELVFFRVDEYRGEIVNIVFRDVRWVGLEELKQFDFLDGDLPLIETLVSLGLPR
ncbi:MAG TPA: (deoxy)nucleoside triphosphate pyrophosphohydrolase [Candidatus Binatia bacterium]|jgi:8-oxo-dGTP diphosphatase